MPNPATAFRKQLWNTLKHINDAAWLEANSPFASTYFLGDFLHSRADNSAFPRGVALQTVIHAASQDLWLQQSNTPLPKTFERVKSIALSDKRGRQSGHYLYLLLELRFLRRHLPKSHFPTTTRGYTELLNISEPSFFEILNLAVDQLGQQLLNIVRPAIRLEQPSLPSEHLVSRPELATCLRHLRNGLSVAISGSGGVGKTTLALAIREVWSPADVFWFTFRFQGSSELVTLLHAIAHFLHRATGNKSLLWQQLNATDAYAGDPNSLLGLLELDLENLGVPILFCFDEVTRLAASELDQVVDDQPLLLQFLEGVAHITPTLFVGQHVPFDCDWQCELGGFSAEQTATLLQQAQAEIAASDLHQLWQVSDGNPRWLQLYLAYAEKADSAESISTQLAATPAAYGMVMRLWRRLTPNEQQLVMRLSVFHTAAPTDLFAKQQNALQFLQRRQLIRRDTQGGVYLLPLLRNTIYQRLSRDGRDELHLQAAAARLVRGEFTLAAFHYAQAEAYAQAVASWLPAADAELRRGHGSLAAKIFFDVPLRQLKPKAQKQLRIIRSRLALLLGRLEMLEQQGRFEEQSAELEDEDSAEIRYLEGRVQQLVGNGRQADASYADAQATLMRILRRSSQLSQQRYFLNRRLGLPARASAEAQHAQSISAYIQGHLLSGSGEWEAAKAQLETARTLAENIDNADLLGLIYSGLAIVAARSKQRAAADAHWQQALAHYDQMGDVIGRERIRANMVSTLMEFKAYAAVIGPAETSLQFFRKLRDRAAMHIMMNNLAESYLELGDLEQAEAYAAQVLDSPEEAYQPHAAYTFGSVWLRRGKAKEALDVLEHGVERAHATGQQMMVPYLERVRGQAQRTLGNEAAAQTSLQLAADQFAQFGMDDEALATQQLLTPTPTR